MSSILYIILTILFDFVAIAYTKFARVVHTHFIQTTDLFTTFTDFAWNV